MLSVRNLKSAISAACASLRLPSDFSQFLPVFQDSAALRDIPHVHGCPSPDGHKTTSGSVTNNGPSSARPKLSRLSIPSSQGREVKIGGNNVFALVVGIDNYKAPEFPTLRGCRNDVADVVEFLRHTLCVPSPHVHSLMDEEATRSAVIASFDRHLIQNSHITNKSIAVFYFAGHGSFAQVSPSWACFNNTVETICPHDESTLKREGVSVLGIPQPTLHSLLSTLEEKRGCDILGYPSARYSLLHTLTSRKTAILDSCYSGGMSRNLNEDSSVLRTAQPISSLPLLPDLDHDIRSRVPVASRQATLVPLKASFQSGSLDTYTLLAACSQNEGAHEMTDECGNHRGAFTLEFFRMLRKEHRLSYSSIVRHVAGKLRNSHQHPQCGGKGSHRIPFSRLQWVPPSSWSSAVGSWPREVAGILRMVKLICFQSELFFFCHEAYRNWRTATAL
ncbi:hypothetical protein DAEQUDRAFT_548798 [Daedalea quercina L-15889]|uniref:Peptidase C14 caspase domain-containing protein n=1 Tax=Daedalea quercina L-15889 TaxID=1314783 RepID=A0A165T2P8_9APHY|nr:hypothetical protein DAEQUDRAFT_548798 [Daedalea quercina L-15889]